MISVRPMCSEDIQGTASLFQEMQAHYRVACPPVEDIIARLNKLPQGISLFVATDPSVVGFAAVGAIFPGPGLKPGLFLKELFVSAGSRRNGAGTALMRAVARFAVKEGFSRIDWTADRGDSRLLNFYDTLGAVEQNEKVFFRLAGESLVGFAGAPSADPSSEEDLGPCSVISMA